MIKVFISIIKKIRPECKTISAPALQEYSRIYNDLIEKVKLWKRLGVKTFCFITNARLDRIGVIMASPMLIGNHWSCVHFNLETGDGLYADSIGRQVPHNFGDIFSIYFQAIWKVYKEKPLSNPCTLLMKCNEQKARTNLDIFV